MLVPSTWLKVASRVSGLFFYFSVGRVRNETPVLLRPVRHEGCAYYAFNHNGVFGEHMRVAGVAAVIAEHEYAVFLDGERAEVVVGVLLDIGLIQLDAVDIDTTSAAIGPGVAHRI